MNEEATPASPAYEPSQPDLPVSAGLTSTNQLAQTEPKKWQCPYCPQTFADHRKRIGHVRGMHPGQPVPRRTPEEAKLAKMENNRLMRERYMARGLTSTGKPRKIRGRAPYGSMSKLTPHEVYLRNKARYTAKGLNSKGQPFKMSSKAASNVAHAQKMRRQRERREKQRLLNGAAPLAQSEPVQPQDNLGESARAIIMAAQVLRSVSIGMKL